MHTYDNFEYVLGCLGYQGVDQYILHRLGRHEVPKNVDNDAISVFNKMHAFFRARISGAKVA